MAKEDKATDERINEQTGEISEPTILTKLTLKGMRCNPKKVTAKDENDNTPHIMARIYGYGSDIKVKVDASGNAHVGLMGDFEGINLETGDIYRSGILYLPGGIHEQLTAPFEAYNKLSDEDKKKTTPPKVEFALEIASVKASNAAGYSFAAKSLMAPKTDADPLAALRNAVNARVKQIAAPKGK